MLSSGDLTLRVGGVKEKMTSATCGNLGALLVLPTLYPGDLIWVFIERSRDSESPTEQNFLAYSLVLTITECDSSSWEYIVLIPLIQKHSLGNKN